ncbi:MAG: FHA domain-containing protein [Chloroflexi bacterium]|uniref:FHA domain-containing protein n=1 Tax=Candidatus Chlorohelix allophototropha TaxID=3003348 RepID=A0A8T7LYM5_9CHLR|nr:FHA domain-containing protein [Chloroflexota bacterium]WJW67917.1 FHA domain-containing protein [Chloroflexota bacterium L227-S17]
MEQISATINANGMMLLGPEAHLRWGERVLPLRPVGKIVMGRAAGVDYLIADSSVSRRHAEIKYTNGLYYICDLGSTNGVFVSGKRVTGDVALMPGNEVQLGYVKMQFRLGLELTALPVQAKRPAQVPLLSLPPVIAPQVRAHSLQPDLFLHYRLRICSGSNSGMNLKLDSKSLYRIGRCGGLRSDFEINDVKGSELSAYVLKRIDGGFAIRDTSPNGAILLNGKAFDREARPLKSGDTITLGDTVLIFESVLLAA